MVDHIVRFVHAVEHTRANKAGRANETKMHVVRGLELEMDTFRQIRRTGPDLAINTISVINMRRLIED